MGILLSYLRKKRCVLPHETGDQSDSSRSADREKRQNRPPDLGPPAASQATPQSSSQATPQSSSQATPQASSQATPPKTARATPPATLPLRILPGFQPTFRPPVFPYRVRPFGHIFQSPRVQLPASQPSASGPRVNLPDIMERNEGDDQKTVALKREIRTVKKRYDKMTLVDRRAQYHCQVTVIKTLKDMVPWGSTGKTEPLLDDSVKTALEPASPVGEYIPLLNKKIALVKADITHLEVDAIVDAADNSEMGEEGGAAAQYRNILAAAGPMLNKEISLLTAPQAGEARITSGYNLPARYVIHTVCPKGDDAHTLSKCYTACLNLARENSLKSVAFPCISDGISADALKKTTKVALEAVKAWIESNKIEIDRVIFCVCSAKNMAVYYELMRNYFPLSTQQPSPDEDADSFNISVDEWAEETEEGSQDEESSTPDEQDPPQDEQDPAQEEQNPAQEEQNPAQEEQDPPQDEQNPAQEEQDPPQDEQNPAQEEQDPPQDEQDPAQEEQDPPQDEQDPAQ